MRLLGKIFAVVCVVVVAGSAQDIEVGRPAQWMLEASLINSESPSSPYYPGLGVIYSAPINYPFIHLDFGLQFADRYLLESSGEYNYIDTSNGTSSVNSFTHVKYTDRHEIAALVNIAPTVYLKRLFFGIDNQISLGYNFAHSRSTRIGLFSGDTLSSKETNGKGIVFNSQGFSICGIVGYNLKNLGFAPYAGPNKFAVQVRYILKSMTKKSEA